MQRRMTLLETKLMTSPFMEELTYVSIAKTRKGKFLVFLSPVGVYPAPCIGLFKYTFNTEEHARQMFLRLADHVGVCPPRPRGKAKSYLNSSVE